MFLVASLFLVLGISTGLTNLNYQDGFNETTSEITEFDYINSSVNNQTLTRETIETPIYTEYNGILLTLFSVILVASAIYFYYLFYVFLVDKWGGYYGRRKFWRVPGV